MKIEDSGELFVRLAIKINEYNLVYSKKHKKKAEEIYFGKFLSTLRSMLQTPPLEKDANDFKNNVYAVFEKIFPNSKNFGRIYFSPQLISQPTWKYIVCGHENPDLDSMASTLLLSYMLMQSPDYLNGRGIAAILGNLTPYNHSLIDKIMGNERFVDAFFTRIPTLRRTVHDVRIPESKCLSIHPINSIQTAVKKLKKSSPHSGFLPVIANNQYIFGIYEEHLYEYLEYLQKNDISTHKTIADFIEWAKNKYPDLSRIAVLASTFYDDTILKDKFQTNPFLPVINQYNYFKGVISEPVLKESINRKIILVDVSKEQLVKHGILNDTTSDVSTSFDHHSHTGNNYPIPHTVNQATGATVTQILHNALFLKINVPHNILLVCLLAMVDDTDGWSKDKITLLEERVLIDALGIIPQEKTRWIEDKGTTSNRQNIVHYGKDIDSELIKRANRIINGFRIIKGEYLQEYNKNFLGNSSNLHDLAKLDMFLSDYKEINGVTITQLRLDKANDISFTKPEYLTNFLIQCQRLWVDHKFTFKLPAELNSIAIFMEQMEECIKSIKQISEQQQKTKNLNILIKTYMGEPNESHYDEVYITSCDQDITRVTAEFLKQEIKTIDGKNLKPSIIFIQDNYTAILRYEAGTVFSRKKQFSSGLINKLNKKLEEWETKTNQPG